MEKLLHERLREKNKEEMFTGTCSDIIRVVDMRCLKYNDCNSCVKDFFRRLADEIERYYVPREQYRMELENKATDYMKAWAKEYNVPFIDNEIMSEWLERYYIQRPRFEDGEPVKVGDKLYYSDEKDAMVESYTVSSDGTCEIEVDQVAQYNGHVDEPFKRSQPKVLDADGMPINIGDAVWPLYHPVKTELEVLFIDREFDGYLMIQTNEGRYSPDQLSHKEPDSLEKLRDDIRCYKGSHSQWADRLSAIIERGA